MKKSGDEYLASNAFVLLTSDYFQFSKTQCAIFKGADRSIFLDKREYSGPLYEQIDEAVTFVLRNIRSDWLKHGERAFKESRIRQEHIIFLNRSLSRWMMLSE